MAKRVQELARYLVEHYDGEVERIWADADGQEVLKRLMALPGYGEQKARIFLAFLGKQIGVEPKGWCKAAGAYGEKVSRRSVADVVDAHVARRGARVQEGRQSRRQEDKQINMDQPNSTRRIRTVPRWLQAIALVATHAFAALL